MYRDYQGNITVPSMAKPLPVQIRPAQYDSLGHYSVDTTTGSMAAGAATRLIFYCRNTSSSVLVAITELSLTGLIATTAFAAGQILVSAKIARTFSAENATPGGTALTLTTTDQALRSSMGTTAMGVIRIATTAALGAPTWALDDNAIGEINTHSSGGWQTATPIIGSVYLPREDLFEMQANEHPIVLANNEGVAINVTVPATGVWIAGVRMKWSELNAY